jgi:cell division protein FtsB
MDLFRRSGRGRNRRRAKRTPLVAVTPFSRASLERAPGRVSPQARRIVKLAIAAVALYLFVAGNMGTWRLVSLWRMERQLERRETRLSAEVVCLDTKRRMLESDTTYIETIARREYNLARPDEKVYIVIESDMP